MLLKRSWQSRNASLSCNGQTTMYRLKSTLQHTRGQAIGYGVLRRPFDNSGRLGKFENIGAGAEGILEFMTGDEALKGLSLADKLKLRPNKVKVSEPHPFPSPILNPSLNALPP